MDKKCFCGKQAPPFAQLHGWVKDDIDRWYCPDHKSHAYKNKKGSTIKKSSKKEIDHNSCYYCKTSF